MVEPGDRLLLSTDGVVDARNADGQRFGRERFVDFVVRHHSGRQTPHETLRRLMHAVLDRHSGRMEDDATVLLIEWRAGHQERLVPWLRRRFRFLPRGGRAPARGHGRFLNEPRKEY